MCDMTEYMVLEMLFIFIYFKYLFIYLFIFGCSGSSLLHAGFLQLQQAGATLRWGARASHCSGFSCCGAWALSAWASVVVAHGLSSCGSRAQQLWLAGCRAQAQQLWHTGLVALRHVRSCWTRARTRVPRIGRRMHNHCATREVPEMLFSYNCFTTICSSAKW